MPSSAFGGLFAHEEIRRTFLPVLTEAEMRAVSQNIDLIVTAVSDWCKGWSMCNIAYAPPVAIVNIAQLLNLPVESILERVKHSMWVYALDDLMDQKGVREHDIKKAIDECGLIAFSSQDLNPETELASRLHDLRHALQEHSHFAEVLPYWSLALVRMIDGMVYERWMQGRYDPVSIRDPLPPLGEYLHYARSSIAIAYLWLTGLILEPEPLAPRMVAALSTLADQCALAVRLVNDACTFERERQEGGVNSVVLLASERSRVLPLRSDSEILADARDEIDRRADTEVATARRMAGSMQTQTSIADRFVRATEISVELYRQRDFRQWSAEIRGTLPPCERDSNAT